MELPLVLRRSGDTPRHAARRGELRAGSTSSVSRVVVFCRKRPRVGASEAIASRAGDGTAIAGSSSRSGCNAAEGEKAMKALERAIAITALSALLGVALTACNTVEGAGKDIKRAGEAIEDEAAEHN